MLTKKMQVDILAAMLEGINTGRPVRPIEFDEPWRTVYMAVKDAPDRVRAMTEALRGSPDEGEVIGTLMRNTRIRNSAVYRSLHEVSDEIPPIVWCWRNWVPRGMVTMLAAAPGTGKSLMALDLARRVMTPEQPWPDGTDILKNGAVIYIDAEGVPQLHNERARDWQMDTRKFYLLPDPLNAGVESVDLTDDGWRDRLIEMTDAIKPELVVIDSLGDVNSKGENNVEDVRELLNWLTRYAFDFQCGLVIIHHLRKRSGSAFMDLMSQDDVRGSGHIVAKARSLLGLSMIKNADGDDDSDWRRLEVLKTNLCKKPDPIGMELLPGLGATPTISYGTAPKAAKEPTELDRCMAWLMDVLESGPMKPAEVVEEAKAEGYSRSLIYKARAALGKKLHNTAGARSPDNCWEISRV